MDARQFGPGVTDFHLPINAIVPAIYVARLGGRLFPQGVDVAEPPAVRALARHRA